MLDDLSRAGFDTGWIQIQFLAIQSSEISVHKTIILKGAGWSNNRSLVGRGMQVSDDCRYMTLFRRIIEPCNLTHGKAYVKTSFSRQ
jgi:hypothetical protein